MIAIADGEGVGRSAQVEWVQRSYQEGVGCVPHVDQSLDIGTNAVWRAVWACSLYFDSSMGCECECYCLLPSHRYRNLFAVITGTLSA